MELLKSGWLYKQTHGVMRSWQKRWFALTENGRLLYFKTKSSRGQPRGVFYLSECKMVCERGTLYGYQGQWPSGVDHRRCLALVMNGCLVCLYARTKDECWAWVKAMEKSRQECPSPPLLSPTIGSSPRLPQSPSVTESVGSSFSLDDLHASEETEDGVRLASSYSVWSEVRDRAPSLGELPDHVNVDIQQSMITLQQALGNINASAGKPFSFLCNFGKIYHGIPPTVEEREKLGSVIYGKYLAALSGELVKYLNSEPSKEAFLRLVSKQQIVFRLGQSPFMPPCSPDASIWVHEGVLYIAVPCFHFGKKPFKPQVDAIPVVGIDNMPESGMVDLLPETWQDMWDPGEIDKLPSAVKEDIYDAAHLLEGGLEAISCAAQQPLRFECKFDALYDCLSPESPHCQHLGSVVYGEYLLPLSIAIAKLCEDRRKRDDFLSTVYNHRIVFSLQSCEQLLSPVPEHSLVGSENSHLLFQSGTLYLIVANRQFGEEQFQPDLSLLSMCEEQDSMPSLNLQLSSPYVSSRRLPLDVRRDIKNATPFLHSALDRLASVTGKDFLFECNFDDVFVATEASPTNRYIPGSTVYANYLLHACDSIVDYISEDPTTRRSEFLETVHRHQIVFSCGSLQSLSELNSVNKEDHEGSMSSQSAAAFTYRGVLHIFCPGDHFGEEVFHMDISNLQSVPDEEELSFSGDNLSYSFVSDDWSSQVLSMKARPVSESLSRASSGCSTLASVADI